MIFPKKALMDAQGYEPPLYAESFRLKLDLNENLLGSSPKVIEALKNITEDDVKYYPAYGELIDKLANLYDVDKSMILSTNGADEAISYIFNTFISHEDTVLTIKPTFAMPKIYAKATGCVYREISYAEKWVFPLEDLLNNIDEKTKLVIVTSPNSPTGESISREYLIKILETAKNSIVMLDETYSSYAGESHVDLVKEYNNLVFIKSMSKDYALAGIRLGYIISDRKIIEHIRKVISPYSVNAVACKAGIAALEDVEYFNFVQKQVKQSKKLMHEGLNHLAEKVYKSDANFILADFGKSAEFIYKKLLNAGIKVKYYTNDPDLENCFRITMPDPENAKVFLDTLKSRDLVVFDMDGVLVDTSNSYRMAIKGTYEYFTGEKIEFSSIQQAKNLGGLNNDWDLTEFLLSKEGISVSKEDIIKKFQELYWNDGNGYISNETLLMDPEKLSVLAQDYDLAIFTGRPRLEAEFALKRWNLEKFFPIVITMDDIPDGFHKPHPYGMNHILEIVSPQNTYYLGDTPDDMISAARSGVKGVGILPPQDKSEDLKNRLISEGAMVVLNNTVEIVEFLHNCEKSLI